MNNKKLLSGWFILHSSFLHKGFYSPPIIWDKKKYSGYPNRYQSVAQSKKEIVYLHYVVSAQE